MLLHSWKGAYASIRLSTKIGYTCWDTVATGVTVITRVYIGGKILGEVHDAHKQSIQGFS